MGATGGAYPLPKSIHKEAARTSHRELVGNDSKTINGAVKGVDDV